MEEEEGGMEREEEGGMEREEEGTEEREVECVTSLADLGQESCKTVGIKKYFSVIGNSLVLYVG